MHTKKENENMKTNDRQLAELMTAVDNGSVQLPDFQRGWVWDDDRIKALILSVIRNFPIGAAMFLEYGNESTRFKYRTIEGSDASSDKVPSELILDGQQRLTSLYNALYSKNPVHTITDKGKEIDRYYYLDIEKALDDSVDDIELIVSVPSSRRITSDFGRNVEKDLSTRQDEFRLKMFPLNIILDSIEEQKWQNEYYSYYNYDSMVIQHFTMLFSKIIMPTQKYVIPVISLDKETPKEAVCQVFENVNTGGVSLTVFELVTAIFAMEDFQLRQDWEKRREKYFSGDLLNVVTATDFLTALTLLSTFKSNGTVSCKKKDVLALQLNTYQKYADRLCNGFSEAEKLLKEERIFSGRNLPYSTQLIPLSAICTALNDMDIIHTTTVRNKVKQWYWCGVFGELYGSANETRYANDITQVIKWITDDGDLPKTITDFYFNPTRLLSMQTRQSAAYKGIMALILKNHACDFISGTEMDFSTYLIEKIDLHHIFGKIERKGSASMAELDGNVETHFIDSILLRNDNFHDFIIDRATKLLNAIESATGRKISGRDSDEVQLAFGGML